MKWVFEFEAIFYKIICLWIRYFISIWMVVVMEELWVKNLFIFRINIG